MTSTEIAYDRTTRDYAMYVDGALVGFAANYRDASIALDPPGENPMGDTEGDPEPPPETCLNCAAAHHTQRCPAIWKPLRMDVLTCDDCGKEQSVPSFQFAHTFDMCICDTCYHEAMSAAPIRCDECGDVIDHAGMCLACQEDTQVGILTVLDLDYTPAPWAA
jgi:hypothetical protein